MTTPQEVLQGSGQGRPGDTVVNSNGDTVGIVAADGSVTLDASLGGGSAPQVQYTNPVAAAAAMAETARGLNPTAASTADPAIAAAAAAAAQAAAAAEMLARERAAAKAREQRNAFVRLRAVLDDYGLGDLADTVQGWLQDDLSEAEIVQRMRDTPQFKKRFPAIEARTKAGLSPLSPGEYVAYERQARQIMRAAGLPPGFYDSNDDFTGFLVKDVSTAELTDRVTLASNAAFNSDPETRKALADFGMTGGDLTAFFLDPEMAQPLLERKYNGARLSAVGQKAGFGYLDELEATSLVQTGVTEGQAAQGFGQLAENRELFGSLDAGEDQIGRDAQLGATFRSDGNSRRRIAQRARRRQSAFEGGGSFASGQEGVSGLGDND